MYENLGNREISKVTEINNIKTKEQHHTMLWVVRKEKAHEGEGGEGAGLRKVFYTLCNVCLLP